MYQTGQRCTWTLLRWMVHERGPTRVEVGRTHEHPALRRGNAAGDFSSIVFGRIVVGVRERQLRLLRWALRRESSLAACSAIGLGAVGSPNDQSPTGADRDRGALRRLSGQNR